MIRRILWLSFTFGLLSLGGMACNTGVVQVGHYDATADLSADTSAADLPFTPDLQLKIDLTAKAGDPCTYGKCADKLICMANVCLEMCNGGCGEAAPECPAGIGCYWASDFTGACLPGTAKYLETCKDGVFCIAGNLCVTTVKGQPPKCLKLCNEGCPPGAPCVETNSGCKICLQ
jgi:hypothetical protein